jgi:hypothetical protein
MSLYIPKSPDGLTVKMNRLWNGEKCLDDRLWAKLTFTRRKEGLDITVVSPMLHEQSSPEFPIGARVDGLWEFDVVELFLVGPGHEYIELELGAGGHWLLLGFDRIRHRSNEFDRFQPLVKFEKTDEKMWQSKIVLPWDVIPENTRALNAFAILSGQHLALSPVPGEKPDFHQPDFYPRLEGFDILR